MSDDAGAPWLGVDASTDGAQPWELPDGALSDGGSDGGPVDAGKPVSGDGAVAVTVTPEQTAQRCDPNRPGFVYKASAGPRSEPLVAPTGQQAPIPCYHATGYGAAEVSLSVSKDGTVLYAPVFTADGAGVLTSGNLGVDWALSVPKLENGGTHGRVQPYMYLDPDTDRVWFATNATVGMRSPELLGFNLSYSDDAGKTWSAGHIPIDANDWVKLFAGKPRVSTTIGYPNVLYASAPNPISTPVPYASLVGITPNHQTFYRSLDGGATWQAAGRSSLLAADVPNCDPNDWVIFGSGSVAPDGTAFQVLRRCTQLAMAFSKDDGATWSVRNIPGTHVAPFDTRSLTGIIGNPNVLATELFTTDSAGNLYVVYADDRGSLRYVYSKDGALTWSTPITVQAPNVNAVVYAAIAAKEPGTIAIAYHGSLDHGVSYHGYIAETTDAFGAEPEFITVTVNPPAEPLYRWGFEVGYLGILELADLNEIIHVKYAPNGDLWASFVKDMCDGTATYGKCDWDITAHAKSGFQGVIGRMVHQGAPHFADTLPAAAPPGTSECVRDVTPDAEACENRLSVASENGVCPELASCVCESCRCEIYNCDEDPKCTNLVVCASKNNCRGQECLVLCPNEVKLAGDLQTTRALAVANCANGNTCPAIQFCPIEWLFPPSSSQ